MKARKGSVLTVVVAVVAGAVLFLNGCDGGDDGDEAAGETSLTSVVFVSAAQDEIRKTNPDAMIVTAAGRPAAAETMVSPDESEIWSFVPVDQRGGAPSWDITYDNQQWVIAPRIPPPTDTQFVDLTSVRLDVNAAWGLVRQAGFARPFLDWELLTPPD